MRKLLGRLRRDQDGAVTVDWVVLTAAICGFGILIVGVVSAAATDSSEGIGARLEAMDVGAPSP